MDIVAWKTCRFDEDCNTKLLIFKAMCGTLRPLTAFARKSIITMKRNPRGHPQQRGVLLYADQWQWLGTITPRWKISPAIREIIDFARDNYTLFLDWKATRGLRDKE